MLLKKIYRRIFPTYEFLLEKIISDSKSVLDVGCGYPSPIRGFSKKFYSVGVDVFSPSIEKSRADGIHNKYVQSDVLDIDKKFTPGSFECVLASDLIEHLTKEKGYELLKKMEAIASKKVIIFTPNGFVPQGEHDNNPWQVHLSGWSVDEMKNLGYEVIGVNGWKKLRGEYSLIKLKPKKLWQIISDLTQVITKKHPRKAFQILCLKNVDNN